MNNEKAPIIAKIPSLSFADKLALKNYCADILNSLAKEISDRRKALDLLNDILTFNKNQMEVKNTANFRFIMKLDNDSNENEISIRQKVFTKTKTDKNKYLTLLKDEIVRVENLYNDYLSGTDDYESFQELNDTLKFYIEIKHETQSSMANQIFDNQINDDPNQNDEIDYRGRDQLRYLKGKRIQEYFTKYSIADYNKLPQDDFPDGERNLRASHKIYLDNKVNK
ncbi:MAG TPA: hypothetical protein DHV28_17690 [Ignavibacteriales bacterium]|nr:hypothetical protein [Ignavibacteriales bacterium]